MMDAVPIELDLSFIVRRDEDGGILAKTTSFCNVLSKLGYKPPSGAAAKTDTRFRVYINQDGIYYVSGWLDEGYVYLEKDPDQIRIQPNRRAAIAATRAKI